MHGLLLIDKPSGITSHDVVRRVRRKFGIRRVGHGGTLDPLATGLVPVAVGEATRLLEFLSDGDKGYAATMRLGVTTDSQDADGSIVSMADWSNLTPDDVRAAIGSMRGDLEQVPPMFSALKKNGVPLYRLARQGIDVERSPRPVTIRSIGMRDCALPLVSFDVVCSKGTYIRTLAHDIGRKLGCGAHLTALRRFRHGPFSLDPAVPLDLFESAGVDDALRMLVPLIDMLPDARLVRLRGDAVGRLMNGIPPQSDDTDCAGPVAPGDLVRISDGQRLLAVAVYDPTREREKRGDFVLLKVFGVGS